METKELVFFPTWTAGRKGYAKRIRHVFSEYLEKKDLRLTPQREKILDLLLGAERHLSQEEIYQALKAEGIGRVTVFRMLKLLERANLAEGVTTANGQPRFEIKMERPHHDHLVCIECGHIMEIQWPEVERVQEKTCRKVGFSPLWHRHEIFGRCAECRVKAETP
ncbi:MAG: transcriptional repressor [Elusimicrobia bacterium]|nr:transcriptional repressor [Elusimicrobiota bacterium]